MSGFLSRHWSKGEFNGFLGFFTNMITNLMVLTGILFGIGMPASIIMGSILPGTAVAVAAGCFYWAWVAKKAAKRDNNPNATAFPSGPNVVHLFFVTFAVVGPVLWTTGDPMLAWKTALAWCFIEAVVEVACAFVARPIRRALPRAAMLGSATGIAITLIAMRPAAQLWSTPIIGLVCLSIAVVGFVGKGKIPLKLPVAGLMIIIGSIIAWSTGFMSLETLRMELGAVRLSLPIFSIGYLIEGFGTVAPFIVSAIPLGITNALATLNNLESARAAGDKFDEREALLVDGFGSIVGVIFGTPYPTTVYIGHPGYKAMGARTSYSILTGIATIIVCFFALTPVLIAIIPLEAILAILIFIGLIMGSQAFDASPKRHFPAIILSLIPWLAGWVVTIINNTLSAAGTNAFAEGIIPALQRADIFYMGLLRLSQGQILISLLLGMMTVFIIDGKMRQAALAAVSMAVLAFFGFIHSPALGVNAAQPETIAYIAIAAFILLMYMYDRKFYEEKQRLAEEEDMAAGKTP